MKKPPGIETDAAENVVVLSISPTEEDHTALKRILSRPESTASSESTWTIYPAVALESALPVLRENPIAIVLSERDLVPGTWKDVLAETLTLSDPPLLIVASRLADEYLWAEVLNLGAYDVLAKPFDAEEVIRVLTSAWFHKCINREIRNQTDMKMAAAG
jgi:DNA-binding response OmpR family regulator